MFADNYFSINYWQSIQIAVQSIGISLVWLGPTKSSVKTNELQSDPHRSSSWIMISANICWLHSLEWALLHPFVNYCRGQVWPAVKQTLNSCFIVTVAHHQLYIYAYLHHVIKYILHTQLPTTGFNKQSTGHANEKVTWNWFEYETFRLLW